MKQVVVFTMDGCPHCQEFKKILSENSVEFVNRDIHEHSDETQIIGYFPSNLSEEESPIGWLEKEVANYNNNDIRVAGVKVKSAVRLLHYQPMPNSYTVYIINKTRLFYNFISPMYATSIWN